MRRLARLAACAAAPAGGGGCVFRDSSHAHARDALCGPGAALPPARAPARAGCALRLDARGVVRVGESLSLRRAQPGGSGLGGVAAAVAASSARRYSACRQPDRPHARPAGLAKLPRDRAHVSKIPISRACTIRTPTRCIMVSCGGPATTRGARRRSSWRRRRPRGSARLRASLSWRLPGRMAMTFEVWGGATGRPVEGGDESPQSKDFVGAFRRGGGSVRESA